MGYRYNWDDVVSGGETILLKFVESMKLPDNNSEDSTFDKLKGDYIIRIITVSGKEYEISMKEINNRKYSDKDLILSMIADGIRDKWLHIHKVT